MGLKATIKKGIALADSLTADLQVTIYHSAWIGTDEVFGQPVYADPIARQALVENKQRTLRTDAGQDILQRAVVTFLRPITANGAPGRREPIDIRDKIVLNTGYTGPIKLVEGLENSDSDSPYLLEVILG